jgi:iron complex transport system substrate-binding protein
MKRNRRSRRLLHLMIFSLLACVGITSSLFAQRSGEHVAGHASTSFKEMSSGGQNRLVEEKRLGTRPLDVPLDYIRSARVDDTTISNFPNKTLVIEFKEPMRVISTLEGERREILTVGNHYIPPPCWEILHRLGLDAYRSHIFKAIGKTKKTSCFLFTGADMGNLSVKKEQYRDMIVYALVTAGVESNAMRISADEGRFYEPGTINVILMTNMKLSSRARARAIISATEAKTAAMADLDVRSSASPQRNQATGTGTDEVLVVEGTGTPIENSGGHCKMGELIAKAVYDGVKEAVCRQNAITTGRSVFRRLQERHFDLHGLLGKCDCPADQNKQRQDLARLEELLLQPRYASFIEAAFAVSDAYERGQITSLDPFQLWCRSVADEIAWTWMQKGTEYISSPEIPIVMRMSLNALLHGLAAQEKQ